jgi:hypothetical protein
VRIKVFLPVVVGNLFAGLDSPSGPNPNSSAGNDGFGIRAARVINVPGGITARTAIDGRPGIDAKEILAPVSAIHFRIRNTIARVLDDSLALWYWFQSEETQSVRGAFDCVFIAAAGLGHFAIVLVQCKP